MAEVYRENSQAFVLPTSMASADKLYGLVAGEKADVLHDLAAAVDNAMCKVEPWWISPLDMFIVPTDAVNAPWTTAVVSNQITATATQDDAESNKIHFKVPGKGTIYAGLNLTSITLYYTVGVAELTSVTPALYKKTIASPPTGAAIAGTATGMLLTVASHAGVYAVDTPAALGADEVIEGMIDIVGKNTSVITIYGIKLTFG